VFLSHTSELDQFPPDRSFVAAAQSAVSRAGDAIVEMSSFPASHRLPAAVCEDLVRASDVLVVIAGFQYGSTVPDRPEQSYVELEVDTAGDAGVPRLVFLLGDEAHGPAGLFVDPTGGSRQRAFRERLQHCGVTATFTSPAELETNVLHALTALARDASTTPTRKGRSPQVLVTHSRGTQVGDNNYQVNNFTDR